MFEKVSETESPLKLVSREKVIVDTVHFALAGRPRRGRNRFDQQHRAGGQEMSDDGRLANPGRAGDDNNLRMISVMSGHGVKFRNLATQDNASTS